MAETDTQTPLLLSTSKNKKPPHIVRTASLDDNVAITSSHNKTSIKKAKSTVKLKTAKSSLKIPDTLNSGTAQTNNTLAEATVGNLTFLQNRWTDVKHDSSFIKWIKKNETLVQSKRKHCDKFTGTNAVWDAIRYGYCKSPKMNYNPYVRTSLIKAALSNQKNSLNRADTEEDDDDDDDVKSPKSNEQKEELETVRTTLPIYNGGNDVRLRKCDRNRAHFPLRNSELVTSWLGFEVWSDKIMTAADDFIGAVSIDLTGIKQPGQIYYTQLPLINKRNYSRQMQMKAEEKFEKKLATDNIGTGAKSKIDIFKEKIGYQTVTSEEISDFESSHSDSDINIENNDIQKEKNTKKIMDKIVRDHQHLNITGILHIKAIKKLTRETDVEDVFNENIKHQKYDLEIEILAITNLSTLKLETGMDNRSFYGGILAFILYLLFYAIIMFVAEIDTSTGMNEYKESIWFALVTVTTLGYGDIYAQTPYSKVLNGLFITINIIIISGFIANLLGYVVDAGEEALDHRMEHMMNGAQNVFEHQEQIEQKKLEKHLTQKQLLLSVDDIDSQINKNKNKNKNGEHNRRKSEPINVFKKTSSLKPIKSIREDEEEKKFEEAKSAAKSIEVRTTKATKLKLDELTKLDGDETRKFTTQIYVNVILFIIVVLIGFFTLGVSLLLTGPNFLTNLPYFGYECVSVNDRYCALDRSASTVFVDSLYYTIVSMTTVGYGDIYPQSGAGARILGSIFILFGTLMLVRLLDLVSGYMIWKQNVGKKKRNLGKLLTSHKEFFQFDIDHNGSVSKYEFLVGMLIKLDIIDMQRIDEIMLIFHETDLDGNGFVDRHELKQKIAEDHMKLKWGEDAWKEINKEWNTIKIQQNKMSVDKKTLKLQEKELKQQIKKFEKEKKQWDIEKKQIINRNNKIENNQQKEENEEPYEVNNDIDIVVDDDTQ